MRFCALTLIFTLAGLAQTTAPVRPSDARDERVQVVLKNGHSLIGIIRGGARCEKLVRGRFATCADKSDRAAGVRVWYYQDLDGYIFLEYKSLERLEVLGTLTTDESRALSDAITAARWKSKVPETLAPESRPVADPVEGDQPPAADSALTAEEKQVLDQFPPEKGWNPDKFGEIQRRKIVLHVNPTAEEQAFVDAFPKFQEAFRKWEAAAKKARE